MSRDVKINTRAMQLFFYSVSTVLLIGFGPTTAPHFAPTMKLQIPENGLYEGIFPDFEETQASGWGKKTADYQNLIGKKVAWVTVMNDFTDGILFPAEAVKEVVKEGTTPFIRILPRSERVQGVGPEKVYTLELMAKGKFDSQFERWCNDARETETPLLVEFAQEPNGNWYGWGGPNNGADGKTLSRDFTDGPFRYQEAYRHFVDLCRSRGANNITWFFHVDAQPKPEKDWNKMAYYYPGDDYVDWVGLSVYGAQYPTDYWSEFNEMLEPAYRELSNVTLRKPMALLEVGVIEDPKRPGRKAQWLGDALTALSTNQYPRIKAFTYWHESSWTPAHDNNFRVDSSKATLDIFRQLIQDPVFVSTAIFSSELKQ